MPQISFKAENKKATVNFDFPKLKLKNGERARIAVLQAPTGEYVHNFRKPAMENGKPKMETAKRRDGSEYKTNTMTFVRNPICLGDFATLEDKGSDPKNCPACRMAQTNPDWMQAPKLRFAMHIIRYRTKSSSFNVADMFAVETLVWAFPVRVFNKLIEFGEEVGDLKNADLLLGPCENEAFQKFDITIGQKAEWQASPENKKLTIDTLKDGQIPDLTIAIGNKQTESYMKQDLEDIAEAWTSVSGAKEEPTGSLSDGLDDLFNGSTPNTTSNKPEDRQQSQGDDWTPADTSAADETTTPSNDDDLLGNLLGSDPDESADKKDEKKDDKPAEDAGNIDFDDLLNSI